MRAPDPVFADPRLAELYDVFDSDRSDLDAYVALVEELSATTVVDVGCGTGSLAVRLAVLGVDVVAVDPATASLDLARAKPGAGRVTWVEGDATALAGMDVTADLAVMTGNVAQVFVRDEDWFATLEAVRGCLRADGWLVFETRRPEVRAWERWDLAPQAVVLPHGETVVRANTITGVELPLLTFEIATTVRGEVLRSSSTLRFREREEIERDLRRHGFDVVDVRDAPDRPGQELVLLCRLTGRRPG